MPFPESQRVIYQKNPLIKVICQFRFPPILKIDSEIPSLFQDSIRNEFPIYRDITEFQSEIPAGINSQFPDAFINQLSKSSVSKNHEFISADGLWKINLTRTFLSISTEKYNTWEDFYSRFQSSYNALLSIYAPPFFTRIGVRYIDVINRSQLNLKDISWKELLRPYFLGLVSSEIESHVKSCENVYQIDLIDTKSKVRIVSSFVQNMHDLEECFQIDSDFYYPERIFEKDTNEKLIFLHDRASRLIRWVITEKLHNAMVPKEII
jgi:uncharacterized protein (TIGR04255 family)